MTTTITSTKLDFQTIKDTLKTSLKNTGEFEDYDFEGSGLSNILDVLAYNTHINGLIANFSLNESYLTTAQLRPSVVSLAESLGYVPDSKKSAESTVTLTVNTADYANIRTQQTIEPGELILRGTKDGVDYTFTNRESLFSNVLAGQSVFTFNPTGETNPIEVTIADVDTTRPIKVFEGTEQSIQFIVGETQDAVYVIPDQNMDINTAIIKVYENQQSATTNGEFIVYLNLLDATEIDELSRLYVLRESPNGNYELTFGNGVSLGRAPKAGEVIEVNYLRSSGEIANGIPTLTVASTLNFVNEARDEIEIAKGDINVSVTARSAGAGEKESIESIRKNAPFQYATQNRMVTALDYSALILKKYSTFIKDIKSWGGEDDDEPDYGSVFTSIVFKDNLNNSTIADVRRGILDLADEFSIASFDLKFTDPKTTYIGAQTFFQWNAALTSFSESNITKRAKDALIDYFDVNTGKFDQVFRRSNLLTKVDAVDPSILSSRADIKMIQRVSPVLNLEKNYTLVFPVSIREATATNDATVTSSFFTYKNQTVFIRNKLNQRTRVSPAGANPAVFTTQPSFDLELVTVSGKVVVSNVGSYTQGGYVNLDSLEVQSIPGNLNYIKIFAVPANQSAIDATLNNIIDFDEDESFVKAIPVETR